MPSEYNYKFEEVEEFTRTLDSTVQAVWKHKKGNSLSADQLKEKLGSKLEMATLVIKLAKACMESRKLLSKLHSHNFELCGKLADISFDSQNELKNEISQINEKLEKQDTRSYASVVENNKAFVLPMKEAMRELEKEQQVSCNVVVHGIDIEPPYLEDKKDWSGHVKLQAIDALNLAAGENITKEGLLSQDNMTILGKEAIKGKSPPILVKLKNEDIKMTVLKNSYRLKNEVSMRGVFIARDLSAEERKSRKEMRQKLKAKIKEFPKLHWKIANGKIVSGGDHCAREMEEGDAERTFSYEY